MKSQRFIVLQLSVTMFVITATVPGSAYEIVFDPNSFQQSGPVINPQPPRPGATSRAILVGQTVKLESSAVARVHNFRSPHTEVANIGWAIEFVIQPDPGEPNIPNYPVTLTVTASGSMDTLANATGNRAGRRHTNVMGLGQFAGTGELPGVDVEISFEQMALAKAPDTHDPAVQVFTETRIVMDFLAADGVTKHLLACYANGVARARVWDGRNHLRRPLANSEVDFTSGSYGLNCNIGLYEEEEEQEQQYKPQPVAP